MIKKWILFVILCTVLIWVPVIANARHGGGRHGGGRGDGDFLSGFCLGGALGGALGCMAASRPMDPPPPPPPPPPTCYREVPGHWKERWNPHSGYYERVWIPPYTERYPCR